MTEPLFHLDVEPIPDVRPEPLSADRRRTQRQTEFLERGQHPLAAALDWPIRLHDEAAPVDDRTAPGRRCGNCWERQVFRYHNRSYAKCTYGDGVRVTHGAGTDVRAWWPACCGHTYGDQAVGPDAARYVP